MYVLPFKCMNVKSWDEAVEKYPAFADEKRLSLFLEVKIRNKDGLTQPFKNYCQAALAGKQSDSVSLNGSTGHFIATPYTATSKENLVQQLPNYQGANLYLAGNIKKMRKLTHHSTTQLRIYQNF